MLKFRFLVFHVVFFAGYSLGIANTLCCSIGNRAVLGSNVWGHSRLSSILFSSHL